MKTITALLSFALLTPAAVYASDHPERRQQYKMAVMTETPEFESLPMAAYSQTGHHHLKPSHKHKQSDIYKGKYGGFYYDRHVGKWRDPDDEVCHTCTPENGFPAHGN